MQPFRYYPGNHKHTKTSTITHTAQPEHKLKPGRQLGSTSEYIVQKRSQSDIPCQHARDACTGNKSHKLWLTQLMQHQACTSNSPWPSLYLSQGNQLLPAAKAWDKGTNMTVLLHPCVSQCCCNRCTAIHAPLAACHPLGQSQLRKVHRQAQPQPHAAERNRHSPAHLIIVDRGYCCTTSCHLLMPSLGRAATKALRSRDGLLTCLSSDQHTTVPPAHNSATCAVHTHALTRHTMLTTGRTLLGKTRSPRQPRHESCAQYIAAAAVGRMVA
jgi:hypothetical protein